MMREQITPPERRASTFAVVEPDDTTWDQFTQQHPHGNLLQSAGWGKLKRQFGWQQRRFGITGPDGLVAGAQMLMRRRFRLTAAYVPRGPLLSGIQEADHLLLAALDRQARRSRSIFLRLEPNVLEQDSSADSLHTGLLLYDFHPTPPLQPHSSIHLDLTPDLERISSGMRKGHRADIRRAAREGVTVRFGTSAEDFDTFYAILEATGKRARFDLHSRAYYQSVLHLFAPDSACLLLAERDGNALATAVILAWAGQGLYLYSGSTEEGLQSGAQHAIQLEALRWAKERGCTAYDFWGIPDALGQAALIADEQERAQLEEAAKSDPLFGVYRFKKGFGGTVVRYLPAYDRVYIPALYALWLRRGSF